MEEGVIKRLMTSIKCGVCGQGYEADNVNILGHQEDLWFLNAFCPACQTRCLVAVVVKEDEVLEVTTDLTDAELDKFGRLDRLTADEVLDMHNFLKDFSGDFARLFSRK